MAEHRLLLTPSADIAIRALRGKAAAEWERLEPELKAQGCRAGGYRLLAEDGSWSPYCCKHLFGRWRVISTFGRRHPLDELGRVGEHEVLELR